MAAGVPRLLTVLAVESQLSPDSVPTSCGVLRAVGHQRQWVSPVCCLCAIVAVRPAVLAAESQLRPDSAPTSFGVLRAVHFGRAVHRVRGGVTAKTRLGTHLLRSFAGCSFRMCGPPCSR